MKEEDFRSNIFRGIKVLVFNESVLENIRRPFHLSYYPHLA